MNRQILEDMQKNIYYSDKYYDDEYEYRHVVLPKEMVKFVPKTHLMSEEEWRGIGVQQSKGWVHYMTHAPDYYWRDYTGKIPEDAIVAGKDIHGSDLYIGQTYVRDKGLIAVQINPGIKEVYACSGGIRKLDTHTKILCGPQSSFKWVPVTSTDFHTTLNHKRSVVGGHEDGHGEIGIGRINHRGESMIGKVNSFDSKCADFYFNNGGMEVKVDKYEILVFDDDESGQIGDDRGEDSGSFERYHHYQHRPHYYHHS